MEYPYVYVTGVIGSAMKHQATMLKTDALLKDHGGAYLGHVNGVVLHDFVRKTGLFIVVAHASTERQPFSYYYFFETHVVQVVQSVSFLVSLCL